MFLSTVFVGWIRYLDSLRWVRHFCGEFQCPIAPQMSDVGTPFTIAPQNSVTEGLEESCLNSVCNPKQLMDGHSALFLWWWFAHLSPFVQKNAYGVWVKMNCRPLHAVHNPKNGRKALLWGTTLGMPFTRFGFICLRDTMMVERQNVLLAL